jgi:hypothetical protein
MRRLNVGRLYNEFFYQFPKAFITDPKYKDLSDSAKIIYMLLKDRASVAILKKQYDENGDVYFTFSNKELSQLSNYSERKVTSIKKELMDRDLLEQVQLGGKQKPRLYLGELDVDGVYEKPTPYSTENRVANFATLTSNLDEEHNQNADKSTLLENSEKENVRQSLVPQRVAKFARQEKVENLDRTGFSKLENSQNHSQSLESQRVANFATNIINNNKQSDTNTDTYIDTSKDQFINAYSKSFLSKEFLEEIYVFKHDLTDATELINRIYQAKRQVEKDARKFLNSYQKLTGENYQEALLQTFRRFVGQEKIRRSTEKNVITQRLGYWYKTCVTFWQACLRWENVEGVENFMYGEHTPNSVEIANLEIKVKEAQMSLDNHEFMSWLHGRQQKVSEISLFDYVNEG